MSEINNKRQSNCPIKNDPLKREEANRATAEIKHNLPAGLARPALRALASAGITCLADFTKLKESDLIKMHGVGPNSLVKIRSALDENGLKFLT